MAQLAGNLWEFNLTKIIIVDVTDDYRLMQPPMPSDFYPVLKELWLPTADLARRLPAADLVTGYLYDWHESPNGVDGSWYVGVVHEDLTKAPVFAGAASA